MKSNTSKKKTILIIEDEQALREVLKDQLELENYDVTTAKDGQDGVAKMKKSKFDLVLLDVVMPNMDGFKTLETIQIEGHASPTVMLSNISQSEERARAKKLGAVGYIVKSDTSLSEIVDYIKKTI